MSRIDAELEALQSIYEDEIREIAYDKLLTSKTGVKFIQYEDENVSLKLSIPSSYPENGSVTVISMSFRNINSSVSNDRKLLINSEIESIIERNKGEETLFDVINHLRENTYITDEDTMDELSVKSGLKDENIEDIETPFSESECNNTEKNNWERSSSKTQKIKECSSLIIFHGEITTEKKSRFLSHFAYVNNMAEVKEFREIILSDKKCATATHNIFAFRFICPISGIYYHDCDDDGETAAGGRLGEILRIMGVCGVAVIVTRWYGGTKLGPDRFKLILNSARKLLETEGAIIKSVTNK